MKTKFLSSALIVLSFLFGLLAGDSFSSGDTKEKEVGPEPTSLTSKRSEALPSNSSLTDVLPRELESFENKNLSFNQNVEDIYLSSQSPLRAESMLTAYVYKVPFSEWERKIGEGEVNRKSLLSIIGERLAREDSGRATMLGVGGPFSFDDIQEYYAFVKPIHYTGVDVGPEGSLRAFKEIRTSGHRALNSRAFSNQWARVDPAAVTDNFSDLVQLRDKGDGGDKQFANRIVDAWQERDSQGMKDYVSQLPDGAKKAVFEEILAERQAASEEGE